MKLIILIQLSEMNGAGKSNDPLELLENFVSHIFMYTRQFYEGLQIKREKSVTQILRQDFGWNCCFKKLKVHSYNASFWLSTKNVPLKGKTPFKKYRDVKVTSQMLFIFTHFTPFLTLTNQLPNTKCIKKEIQILSLILTL